MKKILVHFKKTLNKKYKIVLLFLVFLLVLVLAVPPFHLEFDLLGLSIDGNYPGYQLNVPFIGLFPPRNDFFLGMDLSGGQSLSLLFEEGYIQEDVDDAIEIISRRMAGLGYTEYTVRKRSTLGENLIVVQYSEEEVNLDLAPFLANRGLLYFRQLKEDVHWDEENIEHYFLNRDLWEDTDLTGRDVLGAIRGGADVQLILSTEGHEKFNIIMQNNIDLPIGIFIDESSTPFALPVISQELVESEGPVNPVIQGSLTEDSAHVLTTKINSGILPLDLEIGDTVSADPLLDSNILAYILISAVAFFTAIFVLLGIIVNKRFLRSSFFFLFFTTLLALSLKTFSITIGLLVIGVLFVMSLLFLSRLGIVSLNYVKSLKKEIPENLASFKSYRYLKTEWDIGLAGLAIISILGAALNFAGLYSVFLVSFIITLIHLVTYWLFSNF